MARLIYKKYKRYPGPGKKKPKYIAIYLTDEEIRKGEVPDDLGSLGYKPDELIDKGGIVIIRDYERGSLMGGAGLLSHEFSHKSLGHSTEKEYNADAIRKEVEAAFLALYTSGDKGDFQNTIEREVENYNYAVKRGAKLPPFDKIIKIAHDNVRKHLKKTGMYDRLKKSTRG
jgi:hypothetical protein